jgi:glycerophosphoryl diester phosphodiesterase
MNKVFILILVVLVIQHKAINAQQQNIINFKNNVVEIYQNPHKYPNYIMVTAHRGDWRNAPENSLQALEFCIENEVDIMETDLKITKDSVLVLMHDYTLDRTTTGKGLVNTWTLDSIKALRLRKAYSYPTQHQKIPTLEEFLLKAKGKNIMIDLDKSYDYFPLALKVVQDTGTLNQVIFRVNDDAITFFKKYPNLPKEINYMPLLFWNTKYPVKFIEDYIKAPIKPNAFEVIYKTENDSQFLAIKSTEIPTIRLHMNTIYAHLAAGRTDEKSVYKPDSNWGWVIKKGAANIIGTDRPKMLLKYLKKKGLRELKK